jgi:hypothetical protein
MILAAVLSCGFLQGDCFAQRRVPKYRTTQPLSPYLQLFQRNQGGVNNYLLDVRPNIQFQQELNDLRQGGYRAAAYDQQVLRQQTLVLGEAIEATLMRLTPRQATSGQPSTAAGFMNTGSYFPQTYLRPAR